MGMKVLIAGATGLIGNKLSKALQEAGWKEVFAHIMKGTAHGIAPDGLQVALAFMRDRLGMG